MLMQYDVYSRLYCRNTLARLLGIAHEFCEISDSHLYQMWSLMYATLNLKSSWMGVTQCIATVYSRADKHMHMLIFLILHTNLPPTVMTIFNIPVLNVWSSPTHRRFPLQPINDGGHTANNFRVFTVALITSSPTWIPTYLTLDYKMSLAKLWMLQTTAGITWTWIIAEKTQHNN